MHHKNNKKIFNNKSISHARIGLVVLSALMVTSCGDYSFLNRSDKRVITQSDEEYQRSVSRVTSDTPRALDFETNNKNLFAKSLRTDNERLDRLERSVQSIRNDFDTVQPSIRRLMAIESDIQELIGELRDLSVEPTMVMTAPEPVVEAYRAPIAQAPVASAPQKTYQKKSAPAVEAGKATIYDVRSGEHPGKSRLVLDVNTTATYNIDIDNNENVMVIDLPNTTWTAATSKTFPKSSVISSYNVEASDTGHLMIIQLKKNARIGYKATLPANTGSGKRIVLDVVAQ